MNIPNSVLLSLFVSSNVQLPLKYRKDMADMILVYKIVNNINLVDKNKMFTMSGFTATRGHPLKIYKRRYGLNISGTYFSNRVIAMRVELPENVVMVLTHNSFKSRLTIIGTGILISLIPRATFPARGQDIGRHMETRQ